MEEFKMDYSKSPAAPVQDAQAQPNVEDKKINPVQSDSGNERSEEMGEGMKYPSTPPGLEEVQIQQPLGFYPNSPPSFKTMRLVDSIGFIKSEIGKAFDDGDYVSVLDHYQKIAQDSEFVSEDVKVQIRSLAKERGKITNASEAKAFLMKLNTFLDGLKVEWKK